MNVDFYYFGESDMAPTYRRPGMHKVPGENFILWIISLAIFALFYIHNNSPVSDHWK